MLRHLHQNILQSTQFYVITCLPVELEPKLDKRFTIRLSEDENKSLVSMPKVGRAILNQRLRDVIHQVLKWPRCPNCGALTKIIK